MTSSLLFFLSPSNWIRRLLVRPKICWPILSEPVRVFRIQLCIVIGLRRNSTKMILRVDYTMAFILHWQQRRHRPCQNYFLTQYLLTIYHNACGPNYPVCIVSSIFLHHILEYVIISEVDTSAASSEGVCLLCFYAQQYSHSPSCQ